MAADARPRLGKLAGAPRGRAKAAAQGRVAWLATLLNGKPRQRHDLRWQQRQARPAELWLVIVDASASTRRHQALAQTKGVLAELFDQAYRQRARLALLTASGAGPQWQRHGLKASAALQPWLQALGAGGGTPLIAALEQARDWLQARQKRHPQEAQRCLVFTDGRLQRWQALQPMPCETWLVDMELAPVRLGRAQLLAAQLQAEYQHIEQFRLLR
ncbi:MULTISPECIES: VWA domain-containing protein [Pseudomonas]|uniref:Magnesium chelatase subunit ChlD-like protein n=1 Tax=Pseudomonas hunanensis TaxID=1247546 RepID=A0ACC6K1U9_9PSED|nr:MULTISPECIES: VWA domain-containing protein [Pseudomonas]MBP2262091.1 magnesium chelatase subunit ChlD-like protein [Pseudomonas sp. BP8]MDR6712419.1 magnesium chelatase subunit ChlD-like protein [Pseudomonas hunanensis]HDS1735330.1 VWA domain-containing protein [Pseudomonas putida]